MVGESRPVDGPLRHQLVSVGYGFGDSMCLSWGSLCVANRAQECSNKMSLRDLGSLR